MVILFNLLQNHQTVFQHSCTILHSHQQHVQVLISPYPYQHSFFSFKNTIAILVGVHWLECRHKSFLSTKQDGWGKFDQGHESIHIFLETFLHGIKLYPTDLKKIITEDLPLPWCQCDKEKNGTHFGWNAQWMNKFVTKGNKDLIFSFPNSDQEEPCPWQSWNISFRLEGIKIFWDRKSSLVLVNLLDLNYFSKIGSPLLWVYELETSVFTILL